MNRSRLHNHLVQLFLVNIINGHNIITIGKFNLTHRQIHGVLTQHLTVKWNKMGVFYGTQSKFHGVIDVYFLLFCSGSSTKECVPFMQRTGKSSKTSFFIYSRIVIGSHVFEKCSWKKENFERFSALPEFSN